MTIPATDIAPQELDAVGDLRDAIFACYAELARQPADHPKRKTPERGRRRSSLIEIFNEVLENRPLDTFSADHLELLALMFAYWREVEIADDAEVRAPLPDPVQEMPPIVAAVVIK